MEFQEMAPKMNTAGGVGKTGMIRARIDPDLKIKAEAILAELGLNASDAIRLFYRQITLSEGLPFDVRIPNAATRKAIREARAGKNLRHYGSTGEMFEKLGI
jgi:DNA-damage-inducible protein J